MIKLIHGIRVTGARVMLLLDTSALVGLEIELAAGSIGPVRTFLARHKGEDLACSTVTVGELATGSEEIRTRVFLRHLRKISLTEVIAYRAARLDELQRSKGQRLGENDNWIAATALHYSATLVYADRDFDRIDELKRARVDRG
jgi:predicted nucleic acid-binding protein